MGSGTSGKGSSSSRSSSTTNNTTVTNVDNRVYQSDFGAVEAGTGVARDALFELSDISSDALNLGREGLSAGTDNLNLGLGFAERVYGDSLKFGEAAINAIGDNASNFVDALSFNQTAAIDALASNQDSALGFLTDLVDKFGNTASDLARDAVSGFTSLAQKNSESADDRVSRVAIYAFGAVAAVFIVQAWRK